MSPKEVEANRRRAEPLWRETGDGHGTTLIATEARQEAIGFEPLVASAFASARKVKLKPESAPDDTEAPKLVAIRAGTKQAQIIAMLLRHKGATVAEIIKATGWLSHTVRGSISGTEAEAGPAPHRREDGGQGDGLSASLRWLMDQQ